MKDFKEFLAEQYTEVIFLVIAGLLSTAVQVNTYKFLQGWLGIVLLKALIVILLWQIISFGYLLVCKKRKD